MRTTIRWLACLAWLGGGLACGAFEKPTSDQLKAAAEHPALVGDLVKDASVDQAAEVGKDVIVQIVNLDLEPEERDARAASLVKHLMLAIPTDDWADWAISFAKFLAGSPAASMSPSLLSAVQQAIILTGDVELGNAFGNAYNLAMQTVAGAPAGGKIVPPQPPPPPVALPRQEGPPRPPPPPPGPPRPPRPPRPPVPPPYEGQQLP